MYGALSTLAFVVYGKYMTTNHWHNYFLRQQKKIVYNSLVIRFRCNFVGYLICITLFVHILHKTMDFVAA